MEITEAPFGRHGKRPGKGSASHVSATSPSQIFGNMGRCIDFVPQRNLIKFLSGMYDIWWLYFFMWVRFVSFSILPCRWISYAVNSHSILHSLCLGVGGMLDFMSERSAVKSRGAYLGKCIGDCPRLVPICPCSGGSRSCTPPHPRHPCARSAHTTPARHAKYPRRPRRVALWGDRRADATRRGRRGYFACRADRSRRSATLPSRMYLGPKYFTYSREI